MTVDEITPHRVQEFSLKDRTGVVIVEVLEGSPAAEATLRPGDVIKEVARQPVRNLREYGAVLERQQENRPVLLFISRGGRTFYSSLKVS